MLGFSQHIFVVGCPRSGTTLLQKLLLNISGSVSAPETYFFHYLPENYFLMSRGHASQLGYNYPNYVKVGTWDRLRLFMEKHSRLLLSDEEERRIYQIAKSGKLQPRELFESVMRSYAAGNEDTLIEKTPSHLYHVEYLLKLFPNAVILNIVRDPRDVFLSYESMLSKQGKKRRSVSEFCSLWNASIRHAERMGLFSIKFEELLQHPEEVTRHALTKFGINLDSFDSQINADIVPNGAEGYLATVGKKIITDNKGKYAANLPDEKQAIIERLCGDYMRSYGYAPEGKRIVFYGYIYDRLRWFAVRFFLFLRRSRDVLVNVVRTYILRHLINSEKYE